MGKVIVSAALCVLMVPGAVLANRPAPPKLFKKDDAFKVARVPLEEPVYLMAANGEKIKTVSVDHESIARVEVVKDNPSVIRVTGLKKGETYLRISTGGETFEIRVILVGDKVPVQVTAESVPIEIGYAVDRQGRTERGRLLIPSKYVAKAFEAGAAAGSQKEPMAQAPAGRMMFMGLAFSAALITGGLWLVRRSGNGARGILALFLVSSLVGLSAFLPQLLGNSGPPPRILKKLEIDAKNSAVKLDVDITIVPDGDGIRLVLPVALAPPEIKR